MYWLLRLFRQTNHHWHEGFISAEDTHCFILCKCGKEFSASDYLIKVCPNCKRGYKTEFVCYRIPAWLIRLLYWGRKEITESNLQE